MTARWTWTVLLLSIGCADDGAGRAETTAALSTSSAGTTGSVNATGGPTSSPQTSSPMPDSSGPGDGDPGVVFDVAKIPDSGPFQPTRQCKVVDESNAPGPCRETAPPNSFEPEVQWTWPGGASGESSCIVTPLVGNLTDDNEDGEIDLCDTPDIVAVAATNHLSPGFIFLLDGETGAEHMRFDFEVVDHVTPALGDIDDDGLPEIISVTFADGRLVAFDHDGTVAWTGDTVWEDGLPGQFLGDWSYGSVQLADMDADGDVEIIAGNMLADHTGHTLWFATEVAGDWNASTAADLDGDGDLELVLGHAAFHHDGSPMWVANGIGPGFPQVADMDGDGEPEVLVTNYLGISLLEADGSVTYQDLTPTGIPGTQLNWIRPATIHDFDGDGAPEFAVSSQSHYTVYEADGTIVWDADVADFSGVAGGTAFDFLGDGVAEAMYADELRLHVFDGAGVPILQIDRASVTVTEYPVVADIDNDGSAEIVVVSNSSGGAAPAVQAVRDVDDRWIQARRIWNQHAYHVTNVREDGTIPQDQPRSWDALNTFRTNAQIEGGGLCLPPPPG
ncbi:MAG: VCBS repeat-containing protein [Myxococcota bacterium]